jgi:transposase
MSPKEVNRLEVMQRLDEKRMKQKAAAELLGIGERQVKRLLRRYREQGPSGLVSQRRGKPSSHQLAEETKREVLDLLKGKYKGFGPTLACEKMVEVEGLKISDESVRKMMMAEGLWKAKEARKLEVHQMRERRACDGELEQMDGTDHDWFEGRSERCTLLVMIDDATGKLGALSFVPEESFFGYCGLLRQYLAAHGRPAGLYTDKHGIFPGQYSQCRLGRQSDAVWASHAKPGDPDPVCQYAPGERAGGTRQSDFAGSPGQGDALTPDQRYAARQYLSARVHG